MYVWLAFILVRLWGTLRFILILSEGNHDNADHVLQYFQAAGDPSQAFCNFILFCVLDKQVRRCIIKYLNQRLKRNTGPNKEEKVYNIHVNFDDTDSTVTMTRFDSDTRVMSTDILDIIPEKRLSEIPRDGMSASVNGMSASGDEAELDVGTGSRGRTDN